MAIDVSLEMTDTFPQWKDKIHSLASEATEEIQNLQSMATYDVMVGATSVANGTAGTVPAPTAGTVDKFLKGDGTWGDNEYTKAINAEDGTYPLLVSSSATDGNRTVLCSSASGGSITQANGQSTLSFKQLNGDVNYATVAQKSLYSLPFNGYYTQLDTDIIRYAECSSAESEINKVANTNPVLQIVPKTDISSPATVVRIKFANNNTASNPTLNVNNSGAFPIMQSHGAKFLENLSSVVPTRIKANHVYTFALINTGTETIWLMIGGSDLTANDYGTLVSTPVITGPTNVQLDVATSFVFESHSYVGSPVAGYIVTMKKADGTVLATSTVAGSNAEPTTIGITAYSNMSTVGDVITLEVMARDLFGNQSQIATHQFTAIAGGEVLLPTITEPNSNTLIYSGMTSMTMATEPFAVSEGSDTHIASDWALFTDENMSATIAQALNSSDLTSHTFKNLDLSDYGGKQFIAAVRHKGATYGYSDWSGIWCYCNSGTPVYRKLQFDWKTGNGSVSSTGNGLNITLFDGSNLTYDGYALCGNGTRLTELVLRWYSSNSSFSSQSLLNTKTIKPNSENYVLTYSPESHVTIIVDTDSVGSGDAPGTSYQPFHITFQYSK